VPGNDAGSRLPKNGTLQLLDRDFVEICQGGPKSVTAQTVRNVQQLRDAFSRRHGGQFLTVAPLYYFPDWTLAGPLPASIDSESVVDPRASAPEDRDRGDGAGRSIAGGSRRERSRLTPTAAGFRPGLAASRDHDVHRAAQVHSASRPRAVSRRASSRASPLPELAA
jgi:hypothetical protein